MIDPFLQRLEAVEEEEDLDVRLLRSERTADDGLELSFSVVESGGAPEVWHLGCQKFVAGLLGWDFDGILNVALQGDHPTLWPFSDRRSELSFRNRPQHVDQVIGALYRQHNSVTEGWFPLDRFLNRNLPLRELLGGGMGQLADGPAKLLEAYVPVLEDAGMAISVLESGKPRKWVWDANGRGGEFQPYPADLKSLVFGNSYVVGADWAVLPGKKTA